MFPLLVETTLESISKVYELTTAGMFSKCDLHEGVVQQVKYMNKDEPTFQKLSEILEESLRVNRGLIPTLQAVQQVYGNLPDAVIERVASAMKRPLCEVMDLVDFYSFLHREPHGENHIVVCQATTCNAQGSQRVLDALKSALAIEEGQKTSDGRFSLEVKYCLGACGQGPNVRINGKTFTGVLPDAVPQLIADCE